MPFSDHPPNKEGVTKRGGWEQEGDSMEDGQLHYTLPYSFAEMFNSSN